ncbi:hypothetical protein BMS3Bbin15_01920 [archaeon BMS3Bbin15]|nr:hypothetical protein BMS3Bbin15_01920 [archaeon BMS3Bbin15]
MHTDFYNKYEYLLEEEFGTVIIRKDAVAYIRLEEGSDTPSCYSERKENHTTRKHPKMKNFSPLKQKTQLSVFGAYFTQLNK